jgi:cytochrome P450
MLTVTGRVKLDWLFGFMKYGDPWKARRKLFQQHFHPFNTGSHQPKEQEHIHKLLKRLHDSPDNFIEHIRQYVFLHTGIAISSDLCCDPAVPSGQ